MDTHSEAIWQQRSAREIMKEARRRFRVCEDDSEFAGSAQNHVGLASVHWSLVKRYNGWKMPLAVWHILRATAHARTALKRGGLDFNQVDVVTSILGKAPRWLGGDPRGARTLICETLAYVPVAEPQDEMLPHTRALLHVSLANIENRMGKINSAMWNTERALQLRNAIEREEPRRHAQQQLCRVLAACGFFYWDLGGHSNEDRGRALLQDAAWHAKTVSRDQFHKIRRECKKRGIKLSIFES